MRGRRGRAAWAPRLLAVSLWRTTSASHGALLAASKAADSEAEDDLSARRVAWRQTASESSTSILFDESGFIVPKCDTYLDA